jgi:hypothetical protein
VYPVISRQQLGKNITVANTHATIENLLDASFTMFVSYQRKIGD